MGKLTFKAVEAARREPGRHYDGDGLHLQVSKTGAASWCFRFERNDREQIMGLGSLATFNLEEARKRAREARQKLADGINPIEARRAEKAEKLAATAAAAARNVTFKDAARQYYAHHSRAWKSAKHRDQFASSLEAYAYPTFGALAVGAIDRTLVLKAIEPIWLTKTETASRVRGRIESVLNFATVLGWRSGDNPARWSGNLAHVLAAPNTVAKVVHLAALPYVELPAFMLDLARMAGVAPRALEWTILTASRTGEAIGATWQEIDLEGRLWTIPATRIKMKKEHRVPLSDRAMQILSALPRIEAHVFPGARPGEPLSNEAMAGVLKRMNRRDITVHGFRSAFRDWAAERTAYPSEVAEMALAHSVGNKVEAAYRRGDLLARRVRIMQDWAQFVSTPIVDATVTPIRRQA